MSELETLRTALRDELSCLWTDLQTARRDAYKGGWSMHCDWIVERIKTITPLVGPTPWTELDIQLIEDGVYQRIHQEIGVEAPYDEEGVRMHRAYLDGTTARALGEGTARPGEEALSPGRYNVPPGTEERFPPGFLDRINKGRPGEEPTT